MNTKCKDNKQTYLKESNTLDNKHKQMVKLFKENKNEETKLLNEINSINNELDKLNNNLTDIDKKTLLLDRKEELLSIYKLINFNYNEMDYYDNAGDLLNDYYEINHQDNDKESKNILDFLSLKENKQKPEINKNNKQQLFEKYCQIIDGVRINPDDGTNRIKYCNECKIEKVLDISDSAYICPCCGDSEIIILDDEHQIKEYSPYKRLNHFREWLNQFQAKQTPDIPEIVFIDIVKELNKNRINDLSILKKKNMKIILKKLKYNIYYEHIAYIINKLNNLPPPNITRDMEKLFISMFYNIQEPWELYKKPERKNFLSYSYVLHKFCELLELDHLLDHFPLHKDPNKIMENDMIWDKICKFLNWEFISSFK